MPARRKIDSAVMAKGQKLYPECRLEGHLKDSIGF